ncbi:MAG TPA: transketolase family protein [Candidatus Saccharimonadia bacterium]|nr:transketolase family protein [Candidatus Saccharimonadia bacterium]
MSDSHKLASLGPTMKQEPIREGFGRGLLQAGINDDNVVAACADLTDSTKMTLFKKSFPDRFFQVGVAEQNLVTVGSGLAAMGKIPFVSSYAAFSPGRNWEQIRTTICLNDQPVKIIGSHAGISVGPDGATHQMLEDIALMRVLPNMIVVVPCDSLQAEKATIELAKNNKPCYMRLARDATPVITTEETPFEIGKSYVYKEGKDITIFACGTMVYEALVAANVLESEGVSAEIINVATIKPLDTQTILSSVSKTKRVVTVEEAQIVGGLGGAIAEFLSEHLPTRILRLGMQNRFGESGEPMQLVKHFELDGISIAHKAKHFIN